MSQSTDLKEVHKITNRRISLTICTDKRVSLLGLNKMNKRQPTLPVLLKILCNPKIASKSPGREDILLQ